MQKNKYKGLVLAAGRGSRMGGMTEDHPKCLTQLGGRSLLQWQTNAMKKAGLDKTTIVTGYLSETLEDYGFETIKNPEWSTSNMVVSLLYAKEFINEPTIVSYSDIVFGSKAVSALIESPGDFVLAYDRQWLDLWQQRFDDPLDDAESFIIDDEGKVSDIGGKVDDVRKIMGQYMGLFKITPRGMRWVLELIADNPNLRDKLDMTALINLLIKLGRPIYGVPLDGGWCEVDTPSDLKVAESLWTKSVLPLDD